MLSKIWLREIFGRRNHPQGHKTPRARKARKLQSLLPQCEPLEVRFQPACNFNGVDTIFHIGGTGNDNAELKISGVTTNVFCEGAFKGSTTKTTLFVNLGGPFNSLTVNDSAFTGADTYTITSGQVKIASFSYTANYSNVQN